MVPNVDWISTKVNLGGLIAKFGHLRPILASRTHIWPLFHELCHESCALRYVGGVLELRKLDFRGLKTKSMLKSQIIEAKIGLLWPILVINPLKLAFLTSNLPLKPQNLIF